MDLNRPNEEYIDALFASAMAIHSMSSMAGGSFADDICPRCRSNGADTYVNENGYRVSACARCPYYDRSYVGSDE